MSKTAELKGRLGAVVEDIQLLEAKAFAPGTRPEEREALAKSLEAKIKEGEDLKGQLELCAKAEGLTAWTSAPSIDFHGKAGEDTIVTNPQTGAKYVVDASGFGIDQKTMNAICEPGYRRDLLTVMRKGIHKVSVDVLKALQVGDDTAGGYLAPPDWQNRVVMRKPHPTQIDAHLGSITTSRDRVMMPKHKYSTDDIYPSGLRIAWTGELGEGGEDTSLQNWGMKKIDVHTGTFQILASRDLVEDAAFDIESYVLSQVASVYNIGMDNVWLNGTGIGQPAGILKNVGQADEPPTVNVGNPVNADGLIDWIYGLPPQYEGSARALINRTDVWKTWAKIKDTGNNYVFGLIHNTEGGLANARQPVILGYPVIFSPNMPVGGSANNVGVFGDFAEGYLRVRRLGLSVIPFGDGDRDMLKQNLTGWHFRFREGGDVLQERALRVAVQS